VIQLVSQIFSYITFYSVSQLEIQAVGKLVLYLNSYSFNYLVGSVALCIVTVYLSQQDSKVPQSTVRYEDCT